MMTYVASGTLPVRASNLQGRHILAEAGQYVLGIVKVSYSYSICMNSDQRNQGQLFVSWRFRCQYGMRSSRNIMMHSLGAEGVDTKAFNMHTAWQDRNRTGLQGTAGIHQVLLRLPKRQGGPHQQSPPPLTPMTLVSKFHRCHMDSLELSDSCQGYCCACE